ncbi:Cro/CI family transcriptional regulator [Neoroseomonas nitratireducens]|uniref:Cro/CI family transcriptional regulator n=1 Tax=Roseomonas nitratireducens TaxID=2820810 RepID=UPI001FD7D4BE|nr:Cro/CI family transcriptional regulator [Neoroseomonas nitratireducens]
MKDPGLERALVAAGGVAALARALGITKGAVSQWRRVPADRIGAVARLTGIAPHDLDPALPPPGLAEAQAPLIDDDAARADKARRWLEENREAIEAHHRWVEQHGLPLAKYRMF